MENSSSSSLMVCPPTACSEAVVPPLDAATVALSEIAESAREGLLALAVATGLQVMGAWMNAHVEALCGPRGKHHADRTGYRHGAEAGSVTLGGRRVPVTRPRVRAADGSGELPVPAYELFNGTEILGQLAMERMLQATLSGGDHQYLHRFGVVRELGHLTRRPGCPS
jgi:putative transposase